MLLVIKQLFVLTQIAIESLEFMNSVYAKWQIQVVQVSSHGSGKSELSFVAYVWSIIMSKIYPIHVGSIKHFLETRHIIQARFLVVGIIFF